MKSASFWTGGLFVKRIICEALSLQTLWKNQDLSLLVQ
jgi:hypothetical protein